jgi:hypothetical protein
VNTAQAARSAAGGTGAAHVFASERVDRHAAAIEPAFLGEAGWDPRRRVLSFAPEHPLLGRPVCRAADCSTTARAASRICASCRRRLTRLSELLGEHAWRATGLGAPTDIDEFQQRIVTLEQQIVELPLQIEERDQDLTAARAANRELMAQLNVSQPTG